MLLRFRRECLRGSRDNSNRPSNRRGSLGGRARRWSSPPRPGAPASAGSPRAPRHVVAHPVEAGACFIIRRLPQPAPRTTAGTPPVVEPVETRCANGRTPGKRLNRSGRRHHRLKRRRGDRVQMNGRRVRFRMDQTRPDQTRPDTTRPDQTRPDQTRPDQTRYCTVRQLPGLRPVPALLRRTGSLHQATAATGRGKSASRRVPAQAIRAASPSGSPLTRGRGTVNEPVWVT